MRKITLGVFVLLLAGATLAQWGDWRGFEQRLGAGGDWQQMAFAAVLICIGFNAVVHMLGEAFHLESMKRWARAEFLQVSASALIIVLAAELLFNPTFGVFKYLEDNVFGAGGTVACGGLLKDVAVVGPLGIVKCKLQENIYALDNMYESIYKNNLNVERASSACYMLFGMPIDCGSWHLEIHWQVEQAHMLGEKIVPLLVSLHGQFALATYIENNMLAVFLPLGIVLRIFPITRGVGGLLIAIAIGFYLVFPVLFIMLDPTFVKAEGRPSAITQDPDACYPGFRGSAVLINSVQEGLVSGAASYASYADRLALLTVKIMFYPFVAFAFALIFVRAAAPVLGGDTGELMRMVAKVA